MKQKLLVFLITTLLVVLMCTACSKTETVVICGHCSAKVSENSQYCSNCGGLLFQNSAKPSDTTTNPTADPSTTTPPATDPSDTPIDPSTDSFDATTTPETAPPATNPSDTGTATYPSDTGTATNPPDTEPTTITISFKDVEGVWYAEGHDDVSLSFSIVDSYWVLIEAVNFIHNSCIIDMRIGTDVIGYSCDNGLFVSDCIKMNGTSSLVYTKGSNSITFYRQKNYPIEILHAHEELLQAIDGYYWYLDGYEHTYLYPNIVPFINHELLDWQSKNIYITRNNLVAYEDFESAEYNRYAREAESTTNSTLSLNPIYADALISDFSMHVSANKLYMTVGGIQYSFTRYSSLKPDTGLETPTICNHNWNNATCTEPKTCSKCGAINGTPIGHSWNSATCTEPKTCSKCGAIDGSPISHNWSDGKCTRCGEEDPRMEDYRAYEKLIKERIAEIKAEGPLYTGTYEQFSLEVSALNSEINSLNREIMALSNDNSSSARAQRAVLEAELAELEAEREELYAQWSRKSQVEGLEHELENYYNTLFG